MHLVEKCTARGGGGRGEKRKEAAGAKRDIKGQDRNLGETGNEHSAERVTQCTGGSAGRWREEEEGEGKGGVHVQIKKKRKAGGGGEDARWKRGNSYFCSGGGLHFFSLFSAPRC